MCAKNNPAIKKAVVKLEELSEDEQNFMIAERIEKDRRDRIAEVESVVKKWIAQGIEVEIEDVIEMGPEKTKLEDATANASQEIFSGRYF